MRVGEGMNGETRKGARRVWIGVEHGMGRQGRCRTWYESPMAVDDCAGYGFQSLI